MAKYKLDYNAYDDASDMVVLVEAVARYVSSNSFPEVKTILEILAIKETE